ncbi:beta-ketoacyl-[acyl-carrier-protein] synthase family protein [Actinomadura craniellae]|uniref:Beta-ketoacyl-[acyl-carrier-protein] synthase family protein n=1 Tax=Actinomadura craniellae TaxID=2231787 RepID=A0A365H3M5_9ACTN|nr:beta-ketoacyl-[acyl-carrier-protein] synthase family protein [Actinomadura craniellae]RAY12823.1 beta-ketoacyl-[acyl-carrier-protein] synthase family protein [Actinomadura craniellae]
MTDPSRAFSPRDPRDTTRVVVTGMGVKSPAGNTVEDAYATVLSGKPQAAVIPEFLDLGLPVTIGCPVQGFAPEEYFSRAERRQLDRTAQLGVAAAADAVADSGPGHTGDPTRSGVYVGSGGVSLAAAMALADPWLAGPRAKVPVTTVPLLMPNSTAARIAIRHGMHGPCLTVSAACASGAMAIGEAVQAIRAGGVDRAVAGGTDALLAPFFIAAFARLGALSRRNEAPSAASRPFDDDRDGFVMGEGAAFLVLERAEDAAARGARVYGEITGYTATTDGSHIVSPEQDGIPLARAMRAALGQAGLRPEDVGHVNSHGSSTLAGDQAEANALRAVFGAGTTPPITALKGVTGYLLGAGGAFEAAIALRCAQDGLVPPVPNFGGGPEATGLDVVTTGPRRVPPGPVLSCSVGFGGHNAALVLSPGRPGRPWSPSPDITTISVGGVLRRTLEHSEPQP